MAYEVIARKWRPRTFEDVVGQQHVVRTMRNAVEQGRIAQAYLLCGPRGTGKTTLARIFAKALNCRNGPTASPCCECPNCREIETGSSLDVTEIDGASNNSVEDVHETILNSINFMPASGRYRIFYIDEVHMLSQSAFNALLKTLEEPPEHVKFIFATTEPDKVPGTIMSRCQRFDLRRLSITEIAGQLRKISDAENIEIDDDAIYALARSADGGMRDAESALDQMISFTGTKISESDVLNVFGLVSGEAMERLGEAILRGEVGVVLEAIRDMDSSGRDLRRMTVDLIEHFRNVLICRQLGKSAFDFLDIAERHKQAVLNQAAASGASAVLSVMEQLIELESRLRLSLSPRILTESVLIRCAKTASGLVDLEDILKQLAELRASLGDGSAGTTAAAEARQQPAAEKTAAGRNAGRVSEPAAIRKNKAGKAAAVSMETPDDDAYDPGSPDDQSDAVSAGGSPSGPPPPQRFRPNSEIARDPAVLKTVEMLNGKIIEIEHPQQSD